MLNSSFFSKPKKICLISLALLALLLASGALATPVAAAFSSSSGATSLPSNFSSVQASSAEQTSFGAVKLMGTTSFVAQGSSATSPSKYFIPTNSGETNSRPTIVAGNTPIPQTPSQTPTRANSLGSSVDQITHSTGVTTALGVNSFDSAVANGGLTVEPPDQGLCVGNGYVIDAVNLVLQVYSTSFKPLSSDVALANLIGFPVDQQFGVSPLGGGYIISDPRCLYDTGTGHFFLSFLYLGGPGVFSAGGPFPLPDYGYEFVLASQTHSPLGMWNVYKIDVSSDPSSSQCPCFGDQPLLGADANSLLISTNAFPIFANGFYGAQVYLFDKLGMASGQKSVNVVHFDIGQTINPPDGSCAASGGLYCFYSVNPATSPTTDSFDTSNGGTAWAMSSLDFTGAGDTRIAVWAFSHTSSIDNHSPKITLTLYLGQGVEFYKNPGYLVPQKAGRIPLGDVVYSNFGVNTSSAGCVAACPEGGLASNGDGMWDTVVYAQGALWGAINTLVNEGTAFNPNYHMGVAYWIVNAAGSRVALAKQGYVAAMNEELLFPSIGVGPEGNGVMAFTLTGNHYYPSTAYTTISKGSGDSMVSSNDNQGGGVIFVAALGQSPQDGFTEYQNIQNSFYRPRWGDYSWAVWSNGRVYFSSEYIQSPNCSDNAFLKDPTCGGTRAQFANGGTSLNSVAAGS